MTNLLAVETSGPFLSVAVKKGGRPVRRAHMKGFSRHVESLIPLIDRLLKKEKLSIRDIGAFLIGRGPGSFTGLRVGFATLKGFLAVRERPCFGALSLDLIAANVNPGRGDPGSNRVRTPILAVCLNAKRDKLYVRSYRYHKKGWKPLGAPAAEEPGAWLGGLPEGTWIAGDGLAICRLGLLGKLGPLPEKHWYPDAATLIALYERKDPLLRKLTRPKDLLPFYLRASEAEERLKTAGSRSRR
jgi:tRNA threonylcarbamoyladenosine biosynthesis protein TsaB